MVVIAAKKQCCQSTKSRFKRHTARAVRAWIPPEKLGDQLGDQLAVLGYAVLRTTKGMVTATTITTTVVVNTMVVIAAKKQCCQSTKSRFKRHTARAVRAWIPPEKP